MMIPRTLVVLKEAQFPSLPFPDAIVAIWLIVLSSCFLCECSVMTRFLSVPINGISNYLVKFCLHKN